MSFKIDMNTPKDFKIMSFVFNSYFFYNMERWVIIDVSYPNGSEDDKSSLKILKFELVFDILLFRNFELHFCNYGS